MASRGTALLHWPESWCLVFSFPFARRFLSHLADHHNTCFSSSDQPAQDKRPVQSLLWWHKNYLLKLVLWCLLTLISPCASGNRHPRPALSRLCSCFWTLNFLQCKISTCNHLCSFFFFLNKQFKLSGFCLHFGFANVWPNSWSEHLKYRSALLP